MKGYLDGIPQAIDEAAYIDGCTRNTIFYLFASHLSLLPWMDYILPNILLSNDKSKTLAVGLLALNSNVEKEVKDI